MKPNMSSEAVTRRLRQTSELRRLCLALGYKRYITSKKNSPKFIDYKEVLSTFNPGDIAVIKSILDAEGITYFFQGENFTSFGYGILAAPARLMVKKDQVEEAKEILKDLKITFSSISLEENSGEK